VKRVRRTRVDQKSEIALVHQGEVKKNFQTLGGMKWNVQKIIRPKRAKKGQKKRKLLVKRFKHIPKNSYRRSHSEEGGGDRERLAKS